MKKYSWGARWVTKYKIKEFGYKDHISVDQKTKVITNYTVTPSSTHDSQTIKDLIDENDTQTQLINQKRLKIIYKKIM